VLSHARSGHGIGHPGLTHSDGAHIALTPDPANLVNARHAVTYYADCLPCRRLEPLGCHQREGSHVVGKNGCVSGFPAMFDGMTQQRPADAPSEMGWVDIQPRYLGADARSEAEDFRRCFSDPKIAAEDALQRLHTRSGRLVEEVQFIRDRPLVYAMYCAPVLRTRAPDPKIHHEPQSRYEAVTEYWQCVEQ